MNHQEIQDRLNDYVDGLLPESERGEVEQHLTQCEGCRQEAEALRALLTAAGALPRNVLPERDLWPEIQAGAADQEVVGSPPAPVEALTQIVRDLTQEVKALRQVVEDLQRDLESVRSAEERRVVRERPYGGLRVLSARP
jgi:anti-sigma factor RsiW